MKRMIAIFLSGFLIAQSLFAETTPAAQASQDPYMEAWVKASTPREEHKMLQQYVGKWTYTIQWWMAPNTQPTESTGTAETQSILGGKFIQLSAKGTSMGQPFEGLGLTGFDNVQEKFSTVWIDNMGTAMMAGTGTFDASANAIIDQGSFSCPLVPEKRRSYRAVWTLPVNDSYRYDFYSTDEKGKEFKMMEIVYTKAK